MENKPHDTPADVQAEEGEVQVAGPGGIAYSFTPEAADETAGRLMFGAAKAKGQQMQEEMRRKPRG